MAVSEHPTRTIEILARLERARGQLSEAIPLIESARCLPPDVVEILRTTGAFQMVMPRARGGSELDPVEQFSVVEEISTSTPTS